MRRSLLLSLPLLLGACNVFEGISGDTLSTNTAVLVSDGQTALTKGNAAEAVRVYEQAVKVSSASTPEGRSARIGLAAAVTQQAGVSVMTLDRLASSLQALTDAPTGALPVGGTVAARPALALGGSAAQVCSYAPPETRVRVVDLKTVDGYSTLAGNEATFERAKALVYEALGLPANPTAGQIRTALRDARQTLYGGTLDAQQALLLMAVVNIGSAYTQIVAAGANSIEWAVVTSPGASANYFGYCAPSATVLNDVKRSTACAMPNFERAVTALEARADLLNSDISADIAAKARKAYESLEKELGGTCPAG